MTTPARPIPEEWVDAYGEQMKLRLGLDDVLALGAALWQWLTRAEARRDDG